MSALRWHDYLLRRTYLALTAPSDTPPVHRASGDPARPIGTGVGGAAREGAVVVPLDPHSRHWSAFACNPNEGDAA